MNDTELEEKEGAEAVRLYRQILKASDTLIIPEPKHLTWEIFSKKRKAKTFIKPFNTQLIWSVAASLLLLLGISSYLTSTRTVTAGGNLEHFDFSDGSMVQLSPGTVLKYKRHYGWWNRVVTLEGDGIFTVKAGKPFRVTTTEGQVEVLGTVFRVLVFKDYFEVRCKEGTVAVSHKKEKIRLEGGIGYNSITQKIIPNETGHFDSEKGLYYNALPLTHVVAVAEQAYGINIILKTSKTYYFTGRLPLTDKEAALQVLTVPFALEFKTLADGRIEIESP